MSERLQLCRNRDRLQLRLRVKPGSRRQRLVGIHGGALKLEVQAAPEKGKANSAVVKLLAKALDLDLRDLELVSGATSQDKVVAFDLDLEPLRRKFDSIGFEAVLAE